MVVVDAKGDITIVECKLAKNRDIRRKVIGQLFDYAAALWKLDIEDLEQSLAEGGTPSRDPVLDSTRWQETAFRDAVSDNLDNGAFRLIIAVDEITKRLKRTVVFINSRTPLEVRVLELPRAGESGAPRPVAVFYGDDIEEIGPEPRRWPPDRRSFLKGIGSEDARSAADGLLDWAEGKQLLLDYKREGKRGPETAAIELPDRGTLFRIKEQRAVRVSLTGLRRLGDEELIRRLVQDLAKIDARFGIDTKKRGERPEAPLESLAEQSKRDEFLALMAGVSKP